MQILLVVHILSGILALISAAMAVVSKKGQKLHILTGRTYFWSMLMIFLTALPMAVLTSDIFLFLISIFSFYLAFSGRRFAQNRTGVPKKIDWASVGLLLLSALGMFLLAGWYFLEDNSQYIILTVFGIISIAIGGLDLSHFRHNSATGKVRISRHLTNMLGGTIAVITAVLVVNVNIQPQWIVWILPTAVITPVIFWWNIKIQRGRH